MRREWDSLLKGAPKRWRPKNDGSLEVSMSAQSLRPYPARSLGQLIWYTMSLLGRGLISLRHLIVNPAVSSLQANSQRNARFPSKIFLNQCIVTVPPVDSIRSVQVERLLHL